MVIITTLGAVAVVGLAAGGVATVKYGKKKWAAHKAKADQNAEHLPSTVYEHGYTT